MEDFKTSKSQLVAEVDCDGSGKELCEEHNIRGYPTLKWGEPHDLQVEAQTPMGDVV